MHNVYMLAVHSRDDYAYSPRRDRLTNHRRDHHCSYMTYHSRECNLPLESSPRLTLL